MLCISESFNKRTKGPRFKRIIDPMQLTNRTILPTIDLVASPRAEGMINEIVYENELLYLLVE